MSQFSRRIRSELVRAFPEWERFAVEETRKGIDPYLVVTVPPPPDAMSDLPLRISTWGEEITADFDYYHTYFERWNPDDGEDRHKSALLFVLAIMEERIAAASWWQKDRCKFCARYEPGDSLEPRFRGAYTKIRVRSWRGSHNADLAA